MQRFVVIAGDVCLAIWFLEGRMLEVFLPVPPPGVVGPVVDCKDGFC